MCTFGVSAFPVGRSGFRGEARSFLLFLMRQLNLFFLRGMMNTCIEEVHVEQYSNTYFCVHVTAACLNACCTVE